MDNINNDYELGCNQEDSDKENALALTLKSVISKRKCQKVF